MIPNKLLSLPLLLSLPVASLAQGLSQVLSSTDSVSSLAAVLRGYPDLTQSLSGARNITILAPSNEAFSALMNASSGTDMDNSTIAALLSYHVLEGVHRSDAFRDTPQFLPTMLNDSRFGNFSNGGKQVVEAININRNPTLFSGAKMNSSVSTADVTFDGGVIHVIDTVLTLPMNVSTTAIAANLTAAAGALTAADLVDTVDTAQSITIFVPNNEAFQAIGNLLPGLSNEALMNILTYHVVGSVEFSSDLSDDQELTTLQGGRLTIRTEDNRLYVNGAQVILADVITSNGVVHVIDGVLNPNNTDDDPNTDAGETQSPAFESATRVNEVPFTSGVPTPTGTSIVTPSSSSTSSPDQNAASSLKGNVVTGVVVGAAMVFAFAIVV
ncbi:FAS1 domain-containing protein [Morchella snyderi]|nr:FAS1 domain-containing protein [Morchella snyderi]